jgi:hypothetical protein
MSNIINFMAEDKYCYDVAVRPYPASMAIPQWWKDATPYIKTPNNPDGKKVIVTNLESNASFKKCQVMLDTLTSGYIIPLMADVVVSTTSGFPEINWKIKRDVFDLHNKQEVEAPSGYYDQMFKYLNPWIPQLPKGYSALIVPCFGYPNSPFRPLSGIIDYDKTMHPLQAPVFVKKGFEGVVEKGTPMAQIIPFKRSDWSSKFSYLEDGKLATLMDRNFASTIVNNYIKNFWQKKTYK